MGKNCFMFSGQGEQRSEMGKRLLGYASARKVFEVGRKVFNEGGKGLGDRIVDLVINGRRKDISGVVDSQLTMALVGCAYSDVLSSRDNSGVYIGLSLGAYSALYGAGRLKLEDALWLVERRVGLMKDCVDSLLIKKKKGESYMGAVLGCDLKTIRKYVRRKEDIWVANVNSASQVVVSGLPYAIGLAGEYFSKLEGVGFVPLRNVPLPSHCPLMSSASEGMKVLLENVVIGKRREGALYISDCSGKVVSNSGKIKGELAKQVSNETNLVGAIGTARKLGCDEFIDCGPSGFFSRLLDGSGLSVVRGDGADMLSL